MSDELPDMPPAKATRTRRTQDERFKEKFLAEVTSSMYDNMESPEARNPEAHYQLQMIAEIAMRIAKQIYAIGVVAQ